METVLRTLSEDTSNDIEALKKRYSPVMYGDFLSGKVAGNFSVKKRAY
jgi:hypothetical protein